ncbi:MAG: hypothetical protein NXI03_05430, partial [Alphaproteobacteria bacterium]|nr:hypothetical protein [Alphaproteobacteria bacterium]
PQTKPFKVPIALEITSPIGAEFAVIPIPSIALAAAERPLFLPDFAPPRPHRGITPSESGPLPHF